MKPKYGSIIGFDTSPRALLFEKYQGTIKDMTSFGKIMR